MKASYTQTRRGPRPTGGEHAAPSILQRACACGSLHSAEASCPTCRDDKKRLQRAARHGGRLDAAPPIVHDVLRSTGHPLDETTRAFMEPRFGVDFSGVRVHTDARAAASAHAVDALAYTVGHDIVFGEGQHAPHAESGRRLMAHELTHVVQQTRSGVGASAEREAHDAASRVGAGGSVEHAAISGAPIAVHAQGPEERRETPALQLQAPPVTLGWEALLQPGAVQLPPPTLDMSARQPRSFGLVPQLRLGSTAPAGGAGQASTPGGPLRPPITLPPQPSGAGIPPRAGSIPLTGPQKPAGPSSTPEPPSRLPVLTRGQFSLGLRLGFPEAEAASAPGAGPSALQESMRRAEMLNFLFTGSMPTGWDAVDKAKLASAIWGIFSTHIAPDVAARITSGLSTPSGPGRTSIELDAVLLGDFSGAGLSLTIRHP